MDKIKVLKISIIIIILLIILLVSIFIFLSKSKEEELLIEEVSNNVSEEISTETSNELTEEEMEGIISDGNLVMYDIDKSDYYRPDEEEKSANSFEYVSYTDEEIAKEHLSDYIDLLLHFPDEAYNLLDEEYKEKRFGNIDRFREYIEDSKGIFNRSVLSAYKTSNNEGITEYVCRDSYGNYYVFEDTSLMQYKAQLDLYTLNEETAKLNFETYSNEQKVQVNTERFFTMIDSRDYIHAYEYLDETFRNNKFGSYENFKAYIKRNFFTYNDVTFREMESRGSTYIYNIEVASREDLISEQELDQRQQMAASEAEPETSMDGEIRFAQIVMKIEEGIDFVMSFNVENEQ